MASDVAKKSPGILLFQHRDQLTLYVGSGVSNIQHTVLRFLHFLPHISCNSPVPLLVSIQKFTFFYDISIELISRYSSVLKISFSNNDFAPTRNCPSQIFDIKFFAEPCETIGMSGLHGKSKFATNQQ